MSRQNAAIVALSDRILEWEAEVANARANLAGHEQSVRHANNIIAVSEQMIIELRAAIAVLEAK